MRRIFAAFLTSAAVAGCAINPAGSNWVEADFNKYGLNYDAFPIDRLTIGMPRSELAAIFGNKIRHVETNQNGEVLVADRWVSHVGPDDLAERLILNVRDGKLASCVLVQNTRSYDPCKRTQL